MKPFDLKAALAGAPVKLRYGRKAYIVFQLDKPALDSDALVGYTDCSGEQYVYRWCIDGRAFSDGDEWESDIVGMWED